MRGLTEINLRATITSIDGVSAYDLISREAMLEGLRRVEGGDQVVPFVRMFYGSPSEYLWEDATGVVHRIPPRALAATQESLQAGERLVAFLDDICTVTLPERVGPVNVTLQAELWRHAKITVHGGKTKVWNSTGERPEACHELERVARLSDPEAIVWRGSGIPVDRQGIKVLGAPIGHPEFVRRQLEIVSQEHQTLLSRIPHVQDTQCAWLLLVHCASARANYLLRVMHPEAVEEFARRHDAGLWQCLCDV